MVTHEKHLSTRLTRPLYLSWKTRFKNALLLRSGEETSLDLAARNTSRCAGVGRAVQKERQAEEKVLFLLSVDKPQNSLKPSSEV